MVEEHTLAFRIPYGRKTNPSVSGGLDDHNPNLLISFVIVVLFYDCVIRCEVVDHRFSI